MVNINYLILLLFLGIFLTFLPIIIKLYLENPKWLVNSLFFTMSSGVLLRNIFQPRIYLDSGQVDYIGAANFSGDEIWVRISQATAVLFIFFCALLIINRLFFRTKINKKGKSTIFIAGLLLYLPMIISAVNSSYEDFHYGLFLFPVLMISLFLAPEIKFQKITQIAHYSLLIYIYGSLLSIILNPSWASIDYANSWIGIDSRLIGVATHPNSLGYLSAASMLISFNTIRKKRNIVHLLASSTTLILSQSKTAWVAIILIGLYFAIVRLFRHKKTTSSIFIVSLIIGFSTIILLVLQETFLETILPGEIATLTGRSTPWQMTLDIWFQNPILGFGPNLWDLDFRQMFGDQYLWVGQAHNQWLHTLGSSGIFGLITLLIYMFVILRKSINELTFSNHLPLTVCMLMIIRMITETPIKNTLIDESFLIHAIIFFILLNSKVPISANKHEKKTIEVDQCIASASV